MTQRYTQHGIRASMALAPDICLCRSPWQRQTMEPQCTYPSWTPSMFNSFNLFDYAALAIATDPGKSYSVGRNGVMCHHSLVTTRRSTWLYAASMRTESLLDSERLLFAVIGALPVTFPGTEFGRLRLSCHEYFANIQGSGIELKAARKPRWLALKQATVKGQQLGPDSSKTASPGPKIFFKPGILQSTSRPSMYPLFQVLPPNSPFTSLRAPPL